MSRVLHFQPSSSFAQVFSIVLIRAVHLNITRKRLRDDKMAFDLPASCEETTVTICGGGPTGALLSAALSHLRIPNVVLERETAIPTDPRGIASVEDGIRILQNIGVYDRIYKEIGSCKTGKYLIR